MENQWVSEGTWCFVLEVLYMYLIGKDKNPSYILALNVNMHYSGIF